jgi:VanZ family protein
MRRKHPHFSFAICIRFYAPAFLWLGVIWFFSSQEGLLVRGEPSFLFLLERKGAHVFEFFVLAVLLWRVVGLWTHSIFDRIVWTLVWSLWVATSDETHQLFVVGREGKITDIGIDMIGAILGVWIATFFTRKEKKRICV